MIVGKSGEKKKKKKEWIKKEIVNERSEIGRSK